VAIIFGSSFLYQLRLCRNVILATPKDLAFCNLSIGRDSSLRSE
jgi:hypothetical protein